MTEYGPSGATCAGGLSVSGLLAGQSGPRHPTKCRVFLTGTLREDDHLSSDLAEDIRHPTFITMTKLTSKESENPFPVWPNSPLVSYCSFYK